MLMLIDYSSLLFRSFHTIPESVPMHAVYGFLNMLARLVTDRRPDRLRIARDLFALVRDPEVRVLYPLVGVTKLLQVDEAEITRRYGIPGRAYGDFALLRGDPSDGLPGVPGIGEKTAARLIAAHGSLAKVLAAKTLPPAVARRLAAAEPHLPAAPRPGPPAARG